MKAVVATVGVVIALLGSIFSLQGLSIVGPVSSFMYKNPDWISNGVIILSVGLVIVAIGLIAGRKVPP